MNIPYGLRRLHGIFISNNTPIGEVANKLKRVLLLVYKIHETLREKDANQISLEKVEKNITKKDDKIIDKINSIRKENTQGYNTQNFKYLYERDSVSLLYIDVDGLTHINKVFGKQVADEVINIIEKTLSENAYYKVIIQHRTRQEEICKEHYFARRGEDEFLFCLKEDDEYSLNFSRKLCDLIKSYNWLSIAPSLRVTISIGVIQLYKNEDTIDGIIRAYFGSNEAKISGGNIAILGPKSLPKKISKNLNDYGS